jgi:hypothetical protein
MVGSPAGAYFQGMKNPQKPKVLTFGELVTLVYGTYGKREAARIIQLAVDTHAVLFRGPRYATITRP